MATNNEAFPAQWAQPDPMANELLRQVLSDENITSEELAAGDAAVKVCYEGAGTAAAVVQRVGALLDTLQPGTSAIAAAALAEAQPDPKTAASGAGTAAVAPVAPSGDVTPRPSAPPPPKRKRTPKSAAAASPNLKDGQLEGAVSPGAAGVGVSKGLKHFSVKVCEKVQSKGTTNYNEVADELVKEMAADAAAGLGDGAYDEKNVRRRVYDALNVLEALGMISKTKRDIGWIGWPAALGHGESERERLEGERARLAARVERKKAAAEGVVTKAYCLSNLVLRNRDAPMQALTQAKAAGLHAPNPLQLPFMLVHAPAEAEVDIQVSNNERTAQLNLHNWPFQVFDDEQVMKLMGFGGPCLELFSPPGGEQLAAVPAPAPAPVAPADEHGQGAAAELLQHQLQLQRQLQQQQQQQLQQFQLQLQQQQQHHHQQQQQGQHPQSMEALVAADTPLKVAPPLLSGISVLSPSSAVSAMDLGPLEPRQQQQQQLVLRPTFNS